VRHTRPIKTVERTSVLHGSAPDVWARVTTGAAINDEMAPWMRMTLPRSVHSITDVTPGTPLGRCWILAFGVIPIDYDDLVVVELGPGRFLERSRLFSAPVWEHERTVVDAPDGCEVHDRVSFESRRIVQLVPGGVALHRAVIGAIFTHRHRRLRRRYNC
jgi:hypothetical protein